MQQQELTEETLHEGRAALYFLERQLKERGSLAFDNLSESSSGRQPSSSDRRAMDQMPRNTRLNQRFKSLGITLEELDDRGLINGGGSLPNYYTSMKQKQRRSLELQPRSQRLQERGKEGMSKLLNSFFHMIRVLQKRDLNLEILFKSRDREKNGLISKKIFLSTLKQLGLPFTLKELNEIATYYSHGSIEYIDYLSFLSDARIMNRNGNSGANSIELNAVVNQDLHSFAAVVQAMKKMIIDAAKSLNKSPEDIYRMFARWDTQGTGTVTSTQFLRVLARLHIDLSDQDQDFLVELLDTSGMGRVDFDSLIVYCFGNAADSESPSHFGAMTGLAIAFDDTAGETLSAVSIDGNTSLELKSTGSTAGLRRPHTASLTRPYNTLQNASSAQNSHQAFEISRNLDDNKIDSNWVHEHKDGATHLKKSLNRPLTASARVSSANFSANERNAAKKFNEYEEGLELLDLTDEVLGSEDNVFDHNQFRADVNNDLKASSSSLVNTNPRIYSTDLNNGIVSQTVLDSQSSLQSNHYKSDQINDPTDHLVLLAQQILSTLRDIILARYRHGRSLHEIFRHFDRDEKGFFDTRDFVRAVADLRIETSERVASIAISQLALDGEDQVSFGEFKVFVFDADHKLLELNIQEQIASHLEQQGQDYKTWMLEVFWGEEEETVNDSTRISRSEKASSDLGFISKTAFVNALKKIGLVLTTAEVSRVIDRFDIFGNNQCSVSRFVKMLHCSAAWKHAEKVLLYQDEAIKEAQALRTSKKDLTTQQQLPEYLREISEELISMCEYLGIRVLSEQNMIWIAADALKAPLPVNWSVQKDELGRTFFYNQFTGQSRWEHPLDPHFRKLRDKYRQSGVEPEPPIFEQTRTLPSNLKIHHESLPTIPQSIPALKVKSLSKSTLPKSHQRPASAVEIPMTRGSNTNGSKQSTAQDYHYLPFEIKQQPQQQRPFSATASMQQISKKPSSRPPSPNTGNKIVDANHIGQKVDPANEWNHWKVSEAIYSSSYYKNADKDHYNNHEKRPESSKATNRSSAVNRAIAVGRGASAALKLEKEALELVSDRYHDVNINNHQSKEAKLAEMLKGNIIEKLDKVMTKSR